MATNEPSDPVHDPRRRYEEVRLACGPGGHRRRPGRQTLVAGHPKHRIVAIIDKSFIYNLMLKCGCDAKPPVSVYGPAVDDCRSNNGCDTLLLPNS